MCVYCGALERHRLMWLFLERKTDVFASPPDPVSIPTPDPVSIPTPDPVSIPTPDPVSIPTPDPVSIPTPDPVSIPTPDPLSDRPHPLTPSPFGRGGTVVGKRFLHIAPEPTEIRIKQRVGGGYVSADLLDPTADVQMDVTNIQYPDESFDVVYCSHVLEHVSDDRLAMREFRRVLAKDGLALFLVPISAEETLEDPTITDPNDRELAFGQNDHVRRYGPDFVDRLREAGFSVQVVRDSDVATAEEIFRMGLVGSGEIFLATKT